MRLGNASQFSQNDNRNDRRRTNEYPPSVLEKHVSIKIIFYSMNFSGFYYCFLLLEYDYKIHEPNEMTMKAITK